MSGRTLATTLGLAGNVDEAQKVARELLAVDPNFSITQFASWYPLRRPDDLERYTEGLRIADYRVEFGDSIGLRRGLATVGSSTSGAFASSMRRIEGRSPWESEWALGSAWGSALGLASELVWGWVSVS